MRRNAIVCIAKEEDHYIKEWIDYHKKLGFDHFFIYENDWASPIKIDSITNIPFNGDHLQLPPINPFLDTYRT